MRVVRAGAGLRVILHAEQGQIAMTKTFQGRVVQVHVRQLDFGLRQGIGIDGKIMIVRCDLNLTRVQLLNRMIPAMVAEFQLEGFPTQGNAGELVPQANSEDRVAPH